MDDRARTVSRRRFLKQGVATPSFALSDFSTGFISAARFPPGSGTTQIYGLLITFETYILFSARELVARYLGGRTPTTMAQLVTAAKEITARRNGRVYGSVMRGMRSADSIMDAVTSVVYNAWGLAIPTNSQRKEAAWYFIQWATNAANTAAIGARRWGAPRSSAFFVEVPRELGEAARLDGCSPLQELVYVYVPIVAPGLAATAIVLGIYMWDEVPIALSLTFEQARTVPIAVAGFRGYAAIQWNQMAAASIIAIAPMILLVAIVQRHIVKGLVLGAVK